MPLFKGIVEARMNLALKMFGSRLKRRGLDLVGGLDPMVVVIRERKEGDYLDWVFIQIPPVNYQNAPWVSVIIGTFFWTAFPAGERIFDVIGSAIRSKELPAELTKRCGDVEVSLTQITGIYHIMAKQL